MQFVQPDIGGNLELPPNTGFNFVQPYFELVNLSGFFAINLPLILDDSVSASSSDPS